MEKLGVNLKIEYRIIEDAKRNTEEPIVQTVLDTFKGKVVQKWHT
jgi:hypothetical protein